MKFSVGVDIIRWLDKIRSGWENRNVAKEIAETVRQHSKKVAKAASIYGKHFPSINFDKLVKMAKIHDLAEYKERDYTPGEISKEEKHEREKAVIFWLKDNFKENERNVLFELWMEYELQQTEESKIIKNLDRMDAAVQAICYEKLWYENMAGFYDDVFSKVNDPTLVKILEILLKNRNLDVDVYEQYFFLLEVNWDEELYNDKFLCN